MINKLVASIRGFLNKWDIKDPTDRFFIFLTGLWSIYIGINLVFLAQYIWYIYQ